MSISKELLSEALKCKVHHINIEVHESTVVYHTVNPRYKDYPQPKTINIHELMHLCKEWAYEQGYILTQAKRKASIRQYRISIHTKEHYQKEKCFLEHSEPEACFLACEWILENKDN
jgi:hypothetical protein